MLKASRLLLAICLPMTAIFSFAQQPHAAAPVSFPLAFEVNRGQTAPQVHYLGRSREGTVFFTDRGVTIAIPHQGSFRMLFERANASPAIAGEQPLITRSNYLNSDAAQSISGVENFGALRYRQVYPGIDVRFHGRDPHLEHEFSLAAGADARLISLRLEGIDSVRLNRDGTAELKLGKITLSESAPVAWQTIHGKRVDVKAEWKVLAEDRIAIALGNYDHGQPVTIDPVLAYSTHFGGSTGKDITQGTTIPGDTFIEAVVLDPKQNVYVSGNTSATDFPTTAGAFNRTPNEFGTFHADTFTQSGFISKFDSTGQVLIYSTFLHNDVPLIAVDAAGQVYSAKGGDDHFAGPNTGFDSGVSIDKLSADGSHLLYSFQFAKTPPNPPAQCSNVGAGTNPAGIVADNLGHAWVAGSSDNICMPTTSAAFQKTMAAGDTSGYVVKLNTTKSGAASIVYSTFLGGSAEDFITGLAVDPSGSAYLPGVTKSSNFPHGKTFGTANSADQGFTGFVSKLNASGTGLVYSTLLHGVGAFLGPFKSTSNIALDASGNVYLAGSTLSPGFPTTPNAYRRILTGNTCNTGNGTTTCPDGFVTKLNPAGNALVFSTLLGGSNSDLITGIGVNNAGMPFVTGRTNSPDFPTTAGAFQSTYPGGAQQNAFVTALNANGRSLYYSTLLGGSLDTEAASIALDPAWNAWVVGSTLDSDYPVTPKAFQLGLRGNSDGFIAKVVIAADLSVHMPASASSVPRNSIVSFNPVVKNLGPDGSDNVVLIDPIPSGFSFAGITFSTASFCSAPAIGATSGSVVCHKTRLERLTSFEVHIALRAIATSGRNLTNRVNVSARTQDLDQTNNSASATVHVN